MGSTKAQKKMRILPKGGTRIFSYFVTGFEAARDIRS